jgi:hypothetical protein
MIAVQEWYTASEGMDSYSICPRCRGSGLSVLSTTGSQQRFGSPTQAVRFFCEFCQSIHDDPDVAPLPLCPIPPAILEDMRKIPKGTKPLLKRPIDFDTVEMAARRQALVKQTGIDGQPRDFSKLGPTAYLELYWAAFNAFLGGAQPSVGAHEWAGTTASYLPKKLLAIKVGDFRPIACNCTKRSLFLKITDMRLDRATVDFRLIDDAQEGFRRNRNTMHQLSKVTCLLAEQCRQGILSAQLCINLVNNAFNSVNHRSAYFVLRAK